MGRYTIPYLGVLASGNQPIPASYTQLAADGFKLAYLKTLHGVPTGELAADKNVIYTKTVAPKLKAEGIEPIPQTWPLLHLDPTQAGMRHQASAFKLAVTIAGLTDLKTIGVDFESKAQMQGLTDVQAVWLFRGYLDEIARQFPGVDLVVYTLDNFMNALLRAAPAGLFADVQWRTAKWVSPAPSLPVTNWSQTDWPTDPIIHGSDTYQPVSIQHYCPHGDPGATWWPQPVVDRWKIGQACVGMADPAWYKRVFGPADPHPDTLKLQQCQAEYTETRGKLNTALSQLSAAQSAVEDCQSELKRVHDKVDSFINALGALQQP